MTFPPLIIVIVDDNNVTLFLQFLTCFLFLDPVVRNFDASNSRVHYYVFLISFSKTGSDFLKAIYLFFKFLTMS